LSPRPFLLFFLKPIIVFGGNRIIISFYYSSYYFNSGKLGEFGGHFGINLIFVVTPSFHVGINSFLNKNWIIFIDNLEL
jgi:hypothetical protein